MRLDCEEQKGDPEQAGVILQASKAGRCMRACMGPRLAPEGVEREEGRKEGLVEAAAANDGVLQAAIHHRVLELALGVVHLHDAMPAGRARRMQHIFSPVMISSKAEASPC
jgi:hypothetical protein